MYLPVSRLASSPTIGWEIPAGHLTEQHAAAHAVEGFLCAFLKLASLGVCNILHNVQTPAVQALVQALQPIQL